MKRTTRPRISQCMIVKNEEDTIERALSWGKGIVSEQIVVDTGSTDRTVELAEKMGAKVYHFEWIDDFAAAKNFAIEKAKYEWIAFLDADEYFTKEGAEFLLHAIRQLHPLDKESILTAWVNLEDDGTIISVGTQRRVFRNIPTLRYEGRIHEAINTSDHHLIPTVDMTEELTIFHTGYGDVGNAKKEGRNLKLIQRELEERPDDFTMWGYLGQEYMRMEDWDKSEEALSKSISMMPKEMRGQYDVISSLAALRLLEVLIVNPKSEESAIMDCYRLFIEWWPEEADYDYVMVGYFLTKEDWEAAEFHLRRSMEILEQYGTMGKSMMIAANMKKAYELLAVCCFNNDKLEECIRYTTVSLKEDPYLMSTLVVMLKAFHRDSHIGALGEAGAGEVAGFLGNTFYNFSTLKDRLFVLRAAMGAEYGALIKVMRDIYFSPEELVAVDSALARQ